jgi:hypothetical protein
MQSNTKEGNMLLLLLLFMVEADDIYCTADGNAMFVIARGGCGLWLVVADEKMTMRWNK